MSDPDKLPENAPEADLLSVELSEEIAILQGTFSLLKKRILLFSIQSRFYVC